MQPRFMLDTNIVSDLVRNPAGAVSRHIAKLGDDGLAISIVVAAELRYGCAKRASPALTHQVETILSALEILPLDEPADREYARIRHELTQKGRLIGPNDLLIAAHACALGTPLVTNNLDEFSRVGGLKLENWLE
ncbi:type II toxin-antitoxin system VapC family toxin [Bosea sp. BK604]|uniref:type II toxin-antitoxin system VapC family toxin n=1 Tax=Bosea sp. BK604 TaxID=2512180 RepID=UPI001046EEF4|nr:type II toxin-antitoxin system VapC family toxin [Bosea sp. BK604]